MSAPTWLKKIAPPPPPRDPGPIKRAKVERKPPKPKKPRTPLPKENPERKAALKAVQEGPQFALCKKRPCCACKRAWRPTTGHHVLSRGAQGRDEDCAPLCAECHAIVHGEGESGLAKRYPGLDLEAEADALAALLEAKPHDCLAFAILREDAKTLLSRYVCDRCGYVLPDEQEGEDA